MVEKLEISRPGMELRPVFAALTVFCLLARAGTVHAQTVSRAEPTGSSTPAATASTGGNHQAAFEIREYRVLGNTVLPAEAVETAVYPYLGPGKTIDDVEAARKALETAYHDHGFATVFVDVPEQTVDEGIVRLKVTEGKLRRSRVSGARYFSGRQIRSALPAGAENSVPDITTLQNELAKLNTQTLDRTVVPVLKAGPEPGTVDLALKVADHLPFHGSVELSNDNTPDTRPLRLSAALSYDNMFGRLDSLSLQYQVSPQDSNEVSVVAASYTAHVNDDGTRWAFQFIDSKSNVATLGTLAVLGRGKIVGTQLIQPLSITSASSQSFTAGLDYKDFGQDIQLDPNSVVKTPISYINLSLGYSGTWREKIFQWGVDSTLNFGAQGLVNRQQEFADKRFDAPANYVYLRSNATFGAKLPGDFTALLRVGGQYSVDPIIVNEQFTIGGNDSVRGYLEAEELGDIAVKATAQFGSPQLKLRADKVRLDAFMFYDFGRVSTIDALPNEPSNAELRSAGAGFNLNAFDHLTGVLTWAYPLVDATQTHAHASRVLFDVRTTW